MNLLDFLSQIFLFTGYYAKNESYPQPLSSEQERICLIKAAEGDKYAKEKLISHNLRLVAHVAKKYSASLDLDELIAVGNVGLVKGINSYKLGHGTALATYLARCIENEILMTLRSGKRYLGTLHLQDTIGVDGDGNAYTLMDVLEQKEDSVFLQVERASLADKVRLLVEQTLEGREKDIIFLRFGINCTPLTQLQTAEKLGISRSYVSRIESRALEKLRANIDKQAYL